MVSLGIDFGTSTTVAVAYSEGKPEPVRNADGRVLTPSCVAFQPNGEVTVGAMAKRRRVFDPANSIYSVKRILGHPWHQSEVRQFDEAYPFELEPSADNQPRFVTRAGKLSPMEVASHLLSYVRRSPAISDSELASVTLTVPTSFVPDQRDALRQAAAHAGFGNTEIIDEPSAVALAYLEGDDREQVVVVYDLGGGTFDITVLHSSGADYQVLGVGGDLYTDYEVLGAGGDSYLGGDDVDLSCANWVSDQVLETNHWDIRSNAISFQKLLLSCETAKQLLSLTDRQAIDLTGVDEVLRSHSVELSQADVQRLCRDLVRRTFIICDEALANAGITAEQVGTVVLSGGGCHMPFIQNGVAHYFKQRPAIMPDPDCAVATGAALHAGRAAAAC